MASDTPEGRAHAALQEAARYGSGVPSELKVFGLSFVEMSGVSRPIRPEHADTHDLAPAIAATPSTPARERTAADEFRQLIVEISGQADENRGAVTCEGAELPDQPPPRPVSAALALAEAESLMNALDRRLPESHP